MKGNALYVTLVLLFCATLTCATLNYTEQCKYTIPAPGFKVDHNNEEAKSYIKVMMPLLITGGQDDCSMNLTEIYWDILENLEERNDLFLTIELEIRCTPPQQIHFETYKHLELDTGIFTPIEVGFALIIKSCTVFMSDLPKFNVYGRILSFWIVQEGSIIVDSNCLAAEQFQYLGIAIPCNGPANSPQNSGSIFWNECAEIFSTLEVLSIIGCNNNYSINGTQLKNKFPKLRNLRLSVIRIHSPFSYSWNDNFWNISEAARYYMNSRNNDKVAKYLTSSITYAEYYKEIVWANIYRNYMLELSGIPDFSHTMVKLHGLAGKIVITGNNVRSFPEFFFHNVTGLTILDLSKNLLTKLSTNLFKNLTDLAKLHLNGNRLYFLERDLFADLENLKFLDLSANNISRIDSRLFSSLTNLEELHLEYNYLTILPDNFLKEQVTSNSLERLYLNANPLGTIPIYPLYSITVELIDMHECFINSTSFSSLLGQFSYFDYDYVKGVAGVRTSDKGKKLVDFSNCHIENIVFTNSSTTSKTWLGEPVDPIWLMSNDLFDDTVLIGVGNPIQCNCLNIDAFKIFFIEPEDQHEDYWTCMYPPDFKGRNINDLTLDDLYCPLENLTDCPEQCECYSRPSNNETIIVDCRNTNYVYLPTTLPGGQLELWFQNCSITSLSQRHYFPNVSVLDLSDNKIINIRSDQLLKLSHLETLFLHNNHLTGVPIQIKSLNVSNLTLSQNPLICDCHFTWMKKWLQSKKCPISDWQSVKCTYGSNKAQQLIYVHNSMFVCKDEELPWSVIEHVLFPSIIISCVLFVLVSLCLLIYFQRYNVKVLLYMFFGIHSFDKMKDTDGSFKFDAYVIYAKQDSYFVENRLIRILRERGYKVADFHTDLVLGLTYLENAKRIVLKSKRMIFYFTENIPEDDLVFNVWKYTYNLAMCDRLNCIILISSRGFRKHCTEDSILQYIRKGKYIKDTSNLLANSVFYSMPKQYRSDTIELNEIIDDETMNKRVTYIAYNRNIEEIENIFVPELRQFVKENDRSNDIIIFQNALVPGGDFRMETCSLLKTACNFIFILAQKFDPSDENARAGFDDPLLMLFFREANLKSFNSCYNYLLLFTFGDIIHEELPEDIREYTSTHITYPLEMYRECLLEAINCQFHSNAQKQNPVDENEMHADIELL